MLNKNERKGKLDQVAGHIKEAVGTAIGSQSLQDKGAADVAVGKVEETAGKMEEVVDRVAKKAVAAVAKARTSTTH